MRCVQDYLITLPTASLRDLWCTALTTQREILVAHEGEDNSLAKALKEELRTAEKFDVERCDRQFTKAGGVAVALAGSTTMATGSAAPVDSAADVKKEKEPTEEKRSKDTKDKDGKVEKEPKADKEPKVEKGHKVPAVEKAVAMPSTAPSNGTAAAAVPASTAPAPAAPRPKGVVLDDSDEELTVAQLQQRKAAPS